MIRLLMITGLLLSKGFYFRPPLLCSSFLARTSRCLNTFNMDEFIEIKEGSASMLYNKKEEVFYNKVQVFNRDTSIQVIKEFSRLRELEWKQKNNDSIEFQGISILDALAATGLRSIRYLKEVPGVKSLTINDILPAATEAAIANCERNNVDMTKVLINSGDAVELMYGHKDSTKQYDVIDLDPYGTAVPFLDAAVQAVSDGGLLCVTCTDMPVLSGNYPEVCFYKYGCVPLKNSFCHEMSLRMLLHAIDSTANKYQRYIVPWMSLSVDFYVRVFVRVFESPAEVKRSLLKKGMMFQSTQCPTFHIQPMGYMERGKKSKSQGSDGKVEKVPPTNNGMKFVPSFLSVPSSCEECGSNMRMGGPIWIAPIHCKEVVDNILTSLKQYSNLRSKDDASADDGVSSSMDNSQYCPATLTRIKAVLTNIAEELPDVPFYYILSDLCSFLRCEMIPLATFQSALVNAGYRVSRFHREPHSIKTDAPNYVVSTSDHQELVVYFMICDVFFSLLFYVL